MKEIRKRVECFQQIPPLQPGAFPRGPFPSNHQDPNKDDGGDDDGTSGQAGGESRDGRNNPKDGGASWDHWFTDIIDNPEHNVAGGSSARNVLGRPHLINFTGVSSGGGPDIGFHPGHNGGGGSSFRDIVGLGLPHSRNMGGIRGGHSFDLGQLPHENESLRGSSSAGGNNFDLRLPLGSNMTGGNNAGNSFDHWLPRGLRFNPGGNNSVGHNFDLDLPQGNDVGGNSTGGNNFDLWLPHVNNMGRNSAVVNNVDPWLARGDMGGENLGLGLLPGSDFAGSSTGGNPFHGLQGMHRRGYSGGGAGSASGSDLGLPGSFGAGSSDIG